MKRKKIPESITKYLITFAMLMLIHSQGFAGSYSLKQCIAKAIEKSEYSKQDKHFEAVSANDRENLSSIYLPQLKAEAQASYQSDVFKMDLNLPIPGVKMPSAPKEQYNLSLSILQNIYEGGYSSAAKDSKLIELEINKINTRISNQKLEETIAEYYFSVVLLQESIKVFNTLQDNLNVRRKQTQALVNNGVVLNTALNSIDIELLKVEQKIEQAQKDKTTLQRMLSIWIEDDAIVNSELETPENMDYNSTLSLKRPEYDLFENRSKLYENKKDEVKSLIMPNVSAFAKGGYANPNPFNMAKDGADFFYTIGLKFQWNFFDWGNNYRSKENLEINKELVNLDKAIFDKQFENSIVSYKEDISKFQNLIIKDKKIVDLQKQQCESLFTQFSGGTITITDYLTELNNLTQYDINLNTHKIHLLSSNIKLLIKSGNF